MTSSKINMKKEVKIFSLRQTISKQKDRVEELEKENAKLREQNKKLKVNYFSYEDEVPKILSNLSKISIFKTFAMCCVYHDISQRTGFTEAIKGWLKEYHWDKKEPRYIAAKRKRIEEDV